jgi:starch synthase
LLVSIGRLAAQKVSLFFQTTTDGRSALETILDELGTTGVLVMLGSGNRPLEDFCSELALRRKNFVFLCGYSEMLADLLYAAGDLFLMPSTFEPCGISQMLAMRAGQPCVVHAVGGLKDTVEDTVNGYVFSGDTPMLQADDFVATVHRALQLKTADPVAWKALREHAASRRFSWAVAAESYEQELYVRADD